jgi:small redox-active disulfide protein 2
MNIMILGHGCAKCKKTEEYVRNVVKKLGISATITHNKDITTFADYGVMMTPALVINNQLVFEGKIPTEQEIETLIRKTNIQK